MKNLSHNEKCPQFEDISAYVDGELDESTSEFIHIESCKFCKETVNELQAIDSELAIELDVAVPEDFTKNLLQSLQKKTQKTAPQPKIILLNRIMRIAALFVLSAGIFFILFNKTESLKQEKESSTIETRPLVFLNNTAVTHKKSSLKFPPAPPQADSNSIDIRNLTNVSTDSTSDIINYADIGRLHKKQPTATIPPEVNQTWSIDNIKDAVNKFANFATTARFGKDSYGNPVIRVELTKKELAELVRKCESAGFRLLTPNQPQPEQTVFEGNSNSKVSYTATLVSPR